jgi:hypothetical protein
MKRVKVIEEKIRVTTAELAKMFELTPARIGQLCAIGVLEKGKDKHFDLRDAVISYGRYILCPRLYGPV